MIWTELYLNTPIPEIPKIVNYNFTSFKRYIDIFYDGSAGILKVPLETSGRVKGTRGEFVTAVVDNLVVKNQFTNLYDNNTTADYNYYKMYTDVATIPRDPCTDSTYWPYEPLGYQVIDVNKPYYKVTNESPINLSNKNLSQVVGIFFDSSLIGLNPFEILLDVCTNSVYTVDPSDGGSAYMEFIAISYDASWGSTWEQYKYGADDSSGGGSGTVGPGTINYIPLFDGSNTIGDSSLYMDGSTLVAINVDASAFIVNGNKLKAVYDPALSDTLEVPVTVGGILATTTVADLRNKTYEQLWNELLFPTVMAYVETTNSALLSGISTSTLEVGTPMAPSTTATYNPGDINNGDDSNGPNLTGDGNNYEFKLPGGATDGTYATAGNSQGHVFSSQAIVFGSNIWSVTIDYDAGTGAYYDNKGNLGTNLNALRVAGSRSDNSNTITGRRYAWYGAGGTTPTNSAGVRALGNKIFLSATNTGTFDISIPSSTANVYFFLPIGKIVLVQYVESSFADVTSSFTSGAISVNDAGGSAQSYESWTTTIGGGGYPSTATYRVTIS